ncbi:MAG: serine hydrolase [Planctomycetaceae bacterium]
MSLAFACLCSPLNACDTRVSIKDHWWLINGVPVNQGASCEGLLMNARMVNATFEDSARPDFNPDANTDELLAALPDYRGHGINALTLCLQGGMPGYEGARNSAFESDGTLRPQYLQRIERVIQACDDLQIVVILGLYYQRQSAILKDEAAVRAGVVNAVSWVKDQGFTNVVVEIANEYPHGGFVHDIIRSAQGQASLLRLARQTVPDILLTASGYGDGKIDPEVAEACDFLTPHWNGTPVEKIPERLALLQKFGKPIVCNEDDRTGDQAVAALKATVKNGAGYGLMLKDHNQKFPFHFHGAADDRIFYSVLCGMTTYFPPPESKGGWRFTTTDQEIETQCGMDSKKLQELREWLLQSDQRPFAAVVIRRGRIALQVERGNSAVSDSRRVASVSKAICATVLAIASEKSQQGETPRKMTFDDPAFDFIPWAQPLSVERKARITVRQLLNHTSGICPESVGAPNDGSWEYVLGLSGDERTSRLAFDPGTACGYSTHAFAHAALVCESVTGKPYEQFTQENLLQPLGIEHAWFQYYEGREGSSIGRMASHGLGLPARALARIGYCMLQNGRWKDQQVIPEWFVEQTGMPSHDVKTPELRWKLNPEVFSLGWELPSMHSPDSGKHIQGIPKDARYKPGSGGQLIAFVPSLDLVIARQTGGSGAWDYEEFLSRACDAVRPATN